MVLGGGREIPRGQTEGQPSSSVVSLEAVAAVSGSVPPVSWPLPRTWT